MQCEATQKAKSLDQEGQQRAEAVGGKLANERAHCNSSRSVSYSLDVLQVRLHLKRVVRISA